MDKNNLKSMQHRAHILELYVNKKINRSQAAIRLGVSEATVSVLKKKYLSHGKESLVHGNTGRPSSRRIDKDIEHRLVALYIKRNEHGEDFNFTHFTQYTKDNGSFYEATYGVELNERQVARILRRNGLKSPKGHRRDKKQVEVHPLRPKSPYAGELIQVDACLHHFTTSYVKWTFHGAIDDATGLIVGAWFDVSETTTGYFHVLRSILYSYGLPKMLYTDNRTTFIYSRANTPDKDARVQFARACKELGIRIRTTSIPEAKGLVERLMRTVQDRLRSELIAGSITDINQANSYLQDIFIPRYNKRYGKPPSSGKSVFSSLDPQLKQNLDLILAIHHTRTILSGNIISINNRQYVPIDSNGKVKTLPLQTKVTVIETYRGQIAAIYYEGKYYHLKQIADHGKHSDIPPSKDHPWRVPFTRK